MLDTAGFHFVITSPAQTQGKHTRKAIRSHATRAGGARRQAVQLKSWLCPKRELGPPKLAILEKSPSHVSILSVSSPRRVGSDFSGLQLPSGVEPHMIQDLVKCMHIPSSLRASLACNQIETVMSSGMEDD